MMLRNGEESTTTLKSLDRYNNAGGVAVPVFLQDLGHPKAYMRLCCQVYHLLGHDNHHGRLNDGLAGKTNLQHHTFAIAAVPEHNKVSFALRWPAPVLDVIESERTLHLAYTLDPATNLALVWLMDDCGEAWRKHEWQYQSLAMAVQDVWAFAMVFIGMANVHWRLVVAKQGEFTHAEIKGKSPLAEMTWYLITITF